VHHGVEQHRLKEGLRHFRTGFCKTGGNTGGQSTADRALGCVLSRSFNDRAQQSTFDAECVEVGVSQCATKDAHLNQWIAQVLLVADSSVVHTGKVDGEVSPGGASSSGTCHTRSSHTGTGSQRRCTNATGDRGQQQRDGLDGPVYDLVPQGAVLSDERRTQLFVLRVAESGFNRGTQRGTRFLEASQCRGRTRQRAETVSDVLEPAPEEFQLATTL
jgi:hypothetical protein